MVSHFPHFLGSRSPLVPLRRQPVKKFTATYTSRNAYRARHVGDYIDDVRDNSERDANCYGVTVVLLIVIGLSSTTGHYCGPSYLCERPSLRDTSLTPLWLSRDSGPFWLSRDRVWFGQVFVCGTMTRFPTDDESVEVKLPCVFNLPFLSLTQ